MQENSLTDCTTDEHGAEQDNKDGARDVIIDRATEIGHPRKSSVPSCVAEEPRRVRRRFARR